MSTQLRILLFCSLAVLFLFGTLRYAIGANPNAPEDWDSTYETNPSATDSVGQGDDWIRALKQEIRRRLETEHDFSDQAVDDTGDVDDDGRHREGSARAFVEASAPTTIIERDADGQTALDEGRLFFDEDNYDTDVHTLTVYEADSAAFESVHVARATDADSADIVAATWEGFDAVRVTNSTDIVVDADGANCTSVTAPTWSDTDNPTGNNLTWDTESFDDDSMHSTVADEEDLVTPATATRVRVYLNLDVDMSDSGNTVWARIIDNTGAQVAGQMLSFDSAQSSLPEQERSLSIATGPLAVTGGTTTFQAQVSHCGGATMTIETATSSFSMEVIQ